MAKQTYWHRRVHSVLLRTPEISLVHNFRRSYACRWDGKFVEATLLSLILLTQHSMAVLGSEPNEKGEGMVAKCSK